MPSRPWWYSEYWGRKPQRRQPPSPSSSQPRQPIPQSDAQRSVAAEYSARKGRGRKPRAWFGNEYYDVKTRRWKKPGQSGRRVTRFLSILIKLPIGAALAVLVVYPVLPDAPQTWILYIQQQVADLTPWLRSR